MCEMDQGTLSSGGIHLILSIRKMSCSVSLYQSCSRIGREARGEDVPDLIPGTRMP